MSVLIHTGYFSILINGFKAIRWFYYLPLIILFFFLVIFVHELGHFFSFIFQGIKIRAFFIFLLAFVNNKDGFKIKIHLPFLKLVGGMVVPELPNIRNEEEYEIIVRKFSKALIWGPKTSFLYFLLIMITFITLWFTKSNPILIGIFALAFIVTMLLTILVMLSSKVHTDTIYGDFAAYDKMLEDKSFQLVQVSQYITFRNTTDFKTNEFLLNKMTKAILSKGLSYKPFDLGIIDAYIRLIIYSDGKLNATKEVVDKINKYRITSLTVNKHGLETAYLIAALNYYNNDPTKAYTTYNAIKLHRNRHHSNSAKELLELKYEHLLNFNNNADILTLEEYIYKDEMVLLKPLFLIEDLKAELTYQLPQIEYYTELECSI